MLPMTRLKENKARERRIEMEVVVDAYNAVERAMGWYYYLEGEVGIPLQSTLQIQARDLAATCRRRGGSRRDGGGGRM